MKRKSLLIIIQIFILFVGMHIQWISFRMVVLRRKELKYIEKLGFNRDQVYAFGDGLNDLEMIEAVGTGIVMGNGHEDLKNLQIM